MDVFVYSLPGRNMTSAGKVCGTETASSMCYQTMSDGLYVLRLGGGLFGRLTGFPKSDASWEGCGQSGGLHDQMVSLAYAQSEQHFLLVTFVLFVLAGVPHRRQQVHDGADVPIHFPLLPAAAHQHCKLHQVRMSSFANHPPVFCCV